MAAYDIVHPSQIGYRPRRALAAEVVAEAEATLYPGRRRGARETDAVSITKANGTPYQPRHCACLSCANGFTHVGGVKR